MCNSTSLVSGPHDRTHMKLINKASNHFLVNRTVWYDPALLHFALSNLVMDDDAAGWGDKLLFGML